MKHAMIFPRKLCLFFLPLLVGNLLSANTVSVASLADQLRAGEAPVLIDVRSSSAYQAGHIPNAINLPLSVMESRALPPLGEVILYGDGLGHLDMEQARELMQQKPDIACRVLEGGYAAWQTRSGVTTGEKGLQRDRAAVITYEDLMKNRGEGLVIYDLRKPQPTTGGASLAASSDEGDGLRAKLPEARLASGSPLALLKSTSAPPQGGASLASFSGASGGADSANPLLRENTMATDELIVLVDDDNQTATDLARQLRAGGFQRVVVLAGGDLILKFEGRSGLSRQSSPMPFETTVLPPDGGKEDDE